MIFFPPDCVCCFFKPNSHTRFLRFVCFLLLLSKSVRHFIDLLAFIAFFRWNTICCCHCFRERDSAIGGDGDGGGGGDGFRNQFATCLRQFHCYSSDLFAVYFCNVSISNYVYLLSFSTATTSATVAVSQFECFLLFCSSSLMRITRIHL